LKKVNDRFERNKEEILNYFKQMNLKTRSINRPEDETDVGPVDRPSEIRNLERQAFRSGRQGYVES
jgi:hypothetical protein